MFGKLLGFLLLLFLASLGLFFEKIYLFCEALLCVYVAFLCMEKTWKGAFITLLNYIKHTCMFLASYRVILLTVPP